MGGGTFGARQIDFFKPSNRVVFGGAQCDMRHSGEFARAVPVFDIRRNPHHVAFLYGLHGFAPFLETPDAFGNDEILPLGVAMPVGEHIRRKVDDGGGNIAVGRHNGQSGVTALTGEMGGVGGLHGLDGLGDNLGHGLGLDKGCGKGKAKRGGFLEKFFHWEDPCCDAV